MMYAGGGSLKALRNIRRLAERINTCTDRRRRRLPRTRPPDAPPLTPPLVARGRAHRRAPAAGPALLSGLLYLLVAAAAMLLVSRLCFRFLLG